MKTRLLGMLALVAFTVSRLVGQAPAALDTSKLGPQVGVVVPPFSGADQFGKTRTLPSTYGPKGTMLVFFRSADW